MDTNDDIQCDAQAYSTDREYMVGRHQGSIMAPPTVSQEHGQRMPYNNMGGIAFGVPQSNFSGVPPEYEHYDVALVYAKEDLDLALDIQEKLSRFELNNNMNPKICLYDDNCFVASQMCKAENVVKLCTLIFVVLTKNLRDDMVVQAVREEAFGLTRLASKDDCDTTKRYCIRPLHTKSEKDRKGVYTTPSGLLAIDSVDWYDYEKRSFKYRLKQLFDFHLPYRLKREQQDCCQNPFQTAQLHRTVSSDKPNGNMQLLQGQFNMQMRPAMYRSDFRGTPGTVQGNPPPAGLESEYRGQSRAHGNTSVPNIFPTNHRVASPRDNTSSNPVNLANDAQPQGSVDQGPRIHPVLNEASRRRFETPFHGSTINDLQESSSNIRQESLQTDEQNLSVNLSQIYVSNASASVDCRGQESGASGSSSFETDAQPSRGPGAQTGGLTGPDRVDSDNYIGDDALFGDDRSADSKNAPKQDISVSDKPSSVIRRGKALSEKSSEQSTANSSSCSTIMRNNLPQYHSPFNTTDNANPSETFQSLREDDLVREQDLDEDGIATKSEGKLSESSTSHVESARLAKCEDEESTVLKSVDSSQGRNKSSDTTAMKNTDKKDNRSDTSVKLADVADQEQCHNPGKGNDIKPGVGLYDTTQQSPLTADQKPGANPSIVAVLDGPSDDVTSGERTSSGSDKVPSCQGHNRMDVLDNGHSNDGPRNHRGTVVSGLVAGKNIGTVASGPGAEKNIATVAFSPGDGSHCQRVASHQGQRETAGKDDNGPSDGSGSQTSGQEPSDDIGTVGPHQGQSNGSPSPPIAIRTPGDGHSLTDQKVTLAKQSASSTTQTSDSDESSTVPVKTPMTSGSAKHGILDNATKLLETNSSLSDKLETPLAKQGNEEVNKVLTHELKTNGPAHISAAKCAAPNVLKSEVPPTSPVPVIHYHYHAGNQGPGKFDPSVFTQLGNHPQFTPLHVNDGPHYLRQSAAPPPQNDQQRGPVNMSEQAPINIVNCENVQIGSDGKMIIEGQRERMTDRDRQDTYDSLTSAVSNREDSPPPYSIHNPSSPASTYRKTPLTDGAVIPSQIEPRGGNPPHGGQGSVIADVSQTGSESLGNASGLTRDGPHSCFPSERMGNEGGQSHVAFTDLQPGLESASGLSDITSFTVPELGSASDFLEMVQSELSEDRDSSLTGKGGTTLPTVSSKQAIDDSQLTTERSSAPSSLNRSDDTFFCANKRRKLVYLNTAKTLLQQCDFQSEGNSSSVDSELD